MISNDRMDLLQQGIARAQSGDKSEARACFEQLARSQPEHETVWLWLSSVAPDAEACARYLERALEVDPSNQQARQWLGRLRSRAGERSTAWNCPLCAQSFTARPERCARCRADLDLGSLDTFFEPAESPADRGMLEQAITRGTTDRGLEPAERHRLLALAYLNLRQHQKALAQLAALAALTPEDGSLAKAAERLAERLEVAPSPSEPTEGVGDIPSGTAPQERLDGGDLDTAELDPVELLDLAAEAHQRRPVVLVVDDSPTVRTVVSKALETGGYRTVLAADGMEALAGLRETVPDLVLLDVTMPHLDGFKICRVIKDNDLTAHVPVVFLSGKDGFFDKVRGRMAGAVDYLSKPVTTESLLQVVDQHCQPGVLDD